MPPPYRRTPPEPAFPEPNPPEPAAARARIAKTEALLRQACAAATPQEARRLILRRAPIAAESYTLAQDPDCRLRLLETPPAQPGQETRLTLQRQEPRDSRWHEMTLSPEETTQLRRFLALAQQGPD